MTSAVQETECIFIFSDSDEKRENLRSDFKNSDSIIQADIEIYCEA